MRLGIAHHLGWAVAVTSRAGHEVVDRRRIELIEPGLPAAPIHHRGGAHPLHDTGEVLDDAALGALVATVRASVGRMTSLAFDDLTRQLPEAIESISVRAWPADFPREISVQRCVPYESRADSVMYCELLAEVAEARGWAVHRYDAKDVERRATAVLGARAHDVLYEPRARLGPPWAKNHRIALAATVLADAAGDRRLDSGR